MNGTLTGKIIEKLREQKIIPPDSTFTGIDSDGGFEGILMVSSTCEDTADDLNAYAKILTGLLKKMPMFDDELLEISENISKRFQTGDAGLDAAIGLYIAAYIDGMIDKKGIRQALKIEEVAKEVIKEWEENHSDCK